MERSKLFYVVAAIVLVSVQLGAASPSVDVNSVAERYVKLVLEIGLYEPAYVDSYYGPADWIPPLETAMGDFPAEALRTRTRGLIAQLKAMDRSGCDEIETLRLVPIQA